MSHTLSLDRFWKHVLLAEGGWTTFTSLTYIRGLVAHPGLTIQAHFSPCSGVVSRVYLTLVCAHQTEGFSLSHGYHSNILIEKSFSASKASAACLMFFSSVR